MSSLRSSLSTALPVTKIDFLGDVIGQKNVSPPSGFCKINELSEDCHGIYLQRSIEVKQPKQGMILVEHGGVATSHDLFASLKDGVRLQLRSKHGFGFFNG